MKCLVLLFPLLLIACGQQEVNLAFDTQNTADQVFSLEAKLRVLVDDDTSTESPESMNSHLQVRIHSKLLTAYDDGTGRFMMKVDSVSYTSDNRSVEETRHIERYLGMESFQFKMAGDGQMSAVNMDDFVALPDLGDLDIRKTFLKIQPVLPSSPVKMGATWERQHLINDEEGKQLFVYKWFKLEDVFVRNGVLLAKLQMNIKYKQRTDDSLHTMESEDFVLGSGSILFDVNAGKIVEGTLEVEGKMRMIEKQEGAADTIPSLRVHQTILLKSGI